MTRHVHKFRRHRYQSGNEIYFCVLDCAFKVAPALAIGKKTVCHRCGEIFEMNEYSIRLAKPHCENCHKPKSGIKIVMPSKVIKESTFPLPRDSANELRDRLSAAMAVPPTIDEESEDI
jgi:hypothetical protein